MGCAASASSPNDDDDTERTNDATGVTPVTTNARTTNARTNERVEDDTRNETPRPATTTTRDDENATSGTMMMTSETKERTSNASHAMRDARSREVMATRASAARERARGAARKVLDSWNVAHDGGAFRYWLKEDTVVSSLRDDLHGANVDLGVGDGDALSLMMCAGAELEAPIATWDDGSGDGVVIAPVVYAVDVYLTVDGVAFEGGRVCAGEPDFESERAITAALDVCANDGERVLLERALRAGPSDGSKPWCTIVSDRFVRGDYFVHLPLMADYVDGAILDPYSKPYGFSLMWQFAEVCQRIGHGHHEVTIRCAPRGVLGVTSAWTCVCRAIGQKAEEEYWRDARFREFIQSIGENISTSPDAKGMSATFSLTLAERHCVGDKPERRAQEWANDWPEDEIAQCYTIAMNLANTGPPGAMARAMVPGTPRCVHIILPSTDGSSGIAAVEDNEGVVRYHEFHAWALYRGDDADPEARTGAQIKFRCVQYFNDKGTPIEWVAESYGNRPCNGLMLKNRFIAEAVARDVGRISTSL